MATLYKLSWCC